MLEHAAAAFDLTPGTTYLNTAGAGPRLHAVNDAAHRAVTDSARPWAVGEDQWRTAVETLRDLIAELMGTEADGVAYCPSVAYGMSTAAGNLPLGRGQHIVVLGREHPSNRLAWQRAADACGALVHPAERAPDEDWTTAVLRGIDDRTAVVSVPQVHWANGAVLDLVRVAAACRTTGAALVIDASQSLGVLPLDLAALAPDFVIAPGHKWLLGAYGMGWLWASPRWRQEGRPLEASIAAHQAGGDFTVLGRSVPPYRPGARRFDFGAHAHPLLVPMALAAARQLQVWGQPAIYSHLQQQLHHLTQQLHDRGLADGLQQPHAPHFCAWRPPSGREQAAQQAVEAGGYVVAQRAGALRIAPYLHTTLAELDALVDTLAAAV